MATDRLDELTAEQGRIEAEIEAILKARAAAAPHQDVDIDSMTPEMWRSMSDDDRTDWTNYWHGKGCGSFVCVGCGFPLAFGWSRCEACEPEGYAT